MSLNELTTLVEPPNDPVDAGPLELRKEAEAKLGLSLPQDIIDFATTYGSGTFSDEQFWILNPFASWYMDNVQQICRIYSEMKRDEGDHYVPYDVYPIQPGLLPWGSDANGHQMFWLTAGEPDAWPILLFNRDTSQFEEWRMPVTTFLSRIFDGTLQCNLWSEDSQSGLRHVFECC